MADDEQVDGRDEAAEQAEQQADQQAGQQADQQPHQQAEQQPEQQDPDQVWLMGHDIAAELLDDWRYLCGALRARFRTGDFATGVRLVAAIGEAADEANHHPDVDLRYPHVDVALTSHDVGWVTQRDVRLARTISQLADRAGAAPATDQLQVVELALDTPDHEQVRAFWAALLGYGEDGRPDEVRDPGGRFPSLWFQETDPHETPRQRFHVDVHVPPEVAERRVRAAVAAGGTLVDDGWAPSYWVLADADGNRACVCTWLNAEKTPDEDPTGTDGTD